MIAIGLAASACASVAKTASPPAAAASTAPAPTPTPTVNNLTGPLGTTYTVTTEDNDKYSVTLNRVLSHAAPDNSFDAASNGSYLVGAKFTITGISGSSSDDADSDAVAQGSNGQLYDPAFSGRTSLRLRARR